MRNCGLFSFLLLCSQLCCYSLATLKFIMFCHWIVTESMWSILAGLCVCVWECVCVYGCVYESVCVCVLFVLFLFACLILFLWGECLQKRREGGGAAFLSLLWLLCMLSMSSLVFLVNFLLPPFLLFFSLFFCFVFCFVCLFVLFLVNII